MFHRALGSSTSLRPGRCLFLFIIHRRALFKHIPATYCAFASFCSVPELQTSCPWPEMDTPITGLRLTYKNELKGSTSVGVTCAQASDSIFTTYTFYTTNESGPSLLKSKHTSIPNSQIINTRLRRSSPSASSEPTSPRRALIHLSSYRIPLLADRSLAYRTAARYIEQPRIHTSFMEDVTTFQ